MRIKSLALLLSLLPAAALAQSAPANLPGQSVYGRLGQPGDSGPGQALPFATLGANIGALPPGTSVVNPGTGKLEMVMPVQTNTVVSGACFSSCIFGASDLFKKTRRSNSGSAMSDTFPASTATGMVNGARIIISNVDATATLTITAGSGTTMPGGSTDTIGPGRDVAYEYDQANAIWRGSYNTRTSLLSANNLSEITSSSAARTNLGLGNLATQNAGTGLSNSGSSLNLANISADNLLLNATGTSGPPTPNAVNNCSNALTYSTTSHAFGCNTAAGTGTVTTAGTGLSLSGGGSTLNLALTNATLQANPTPGGTFTTSNVMLGMGSTCHLTPVYSGRIHIEFQGAVANNTATDSASLQVRFGTGTAPTYPVAATGTQVGNTVPATSSIASASVPFRMGGNITGLTPGTAYWFDMSGITNAQTETMAGVSCDAFEF